MVERISSNCMLDYLGGRWFGVLRLESTGSLSLLPQLIGAIERELLLLKYR